MNLHIFSFLLLSVLSLGLVSSEQASMTDSAYALVEAIPGKLERFVKDDPKSAVAVIVALASVIIFKDVIVSGAKKTVKMVKKNPVVSFGASLVVAGAAYAYWNHYYNQKPDLIEKTLNSVQGGVKFVSDGLSSGYSQVKNWYTSSKKEFAHMTYESADEAREVVAKAKELLQK